MGTFQLKPSFAGGELTPALYGRIDLQKYDVGAAKLENAIVQRYGGVTRRPGFKHIAQTADNKKARLIPFSYNAEQNYVIELTDKKARVYKDGALVTINSEVVEIETPYTEADLPEIKFAQSADMLFLVHPSHHPAAITRGVDVWTFDYLKIDNGPFDDPNTTDTTLRLEPAYINPGIPKGPFFPACNAYTTIGREEKYYAAPTTWTNAYNPQFHRWITVGNTETDYEGGVTHPGGNVLYNIPTQKYITHAWLEKTPIADTSFSEYTSDIWFRADVQVNNWGAGFYPDHEYGGFVFAVCFDNNDDKPVGVVSNKVGYMEGGSYVSPMGIEDAANYIGPQLNFDTSGDSTYTHYSPYLEPVYYEELTYGSGGNWIKIVIHISASTVQVYHDDNLVFEKTGLSQGTKISHFWTGTGVDCLSNIIVANFDISNYTLSTGNTNQIFDYEAQNAILISSDYDNPAFADDMLGQLVKLTHTVPASYKKGVPGTDDLTLRCVPGASVYVESFGFWEGSFSVEEKDDLGNWVQLKRQSGNRSQNYNMTFQNDDDVMRQYRVVTDDSFDNSVHGDEDPDQRGYVTIQAFSNDYDGIVRIQQILDSKNAIVSIYKTVALPDATLNWALQAWSPRNGYPQAVGFYEDRMVFAGSPKHPQTYWTSKTGDYLNFGTSYPQKDDDAITGTLASGQMNSIKAIVAFDDMILLTTGGEYRVSGGGSNLTPTTQQARAQEYRGINDVPPVIIGGRILYAQRHGNIIRDLSYSYEVDKYQSGDVSILASHLFDEYSIVGMAYQQTPDSVVWCVRSDGVLLGMTYIKEQDLYAWHRHTTQGQFIDVCVIPGDNEDDLYAVVKRGNNYYVERMAQQDENIFVDAAAQYTGAATDTMTGLSWLASEEVQVVGDGNKLTDKTVSALGVLDTDTDFTHIVTGLGYDTTVTTLPIEQNAQDGTTGSRKKRIQRMCVMFRDTIGGRFGFDGKPLDEIKWRSTEAYNEAVQPFNGKKHINLPNANYEETLMLTIKQPDPFPMTILSIIPEVLPGG